MRPLNLIIIFIGVLLSVALYHPPAHAQIVADEAASSGVSSDEVDQQNENEPIGTPRELKSESSDEADDQAISNLQYFKYVENQLQTFNSLVIFLTALVGVIGAILIGIAVASAYMFNNQLKDTRNELRDEVKSSVKRELMSHGENKDIFDKLSKDLGEANLEAERLLSGLGDIHDIKERLSNDDSSADPSFCYQEITRLEAQYSDSENKMPNDVRLKIKLYLSFIIQSALSGSIDPNTLFNAGVTSSKLDFDDEFHKLIALAHKFKKSRSHTMKLAECRHKYGRVYQVTEEGFEILDKSSKEVREESLELARSELVKGGREHCEQVYSSANNIAIADLAAGAVTDFIKAIETSATISEANNGPKSSIEDYKLEASGTSDAGISTQALPSYAYVTLADFHAIRGAEDWRAAYLENTRIALRLIQNESPMSSWYDSSVDNIMKTAIRVNSLEQIMAIAQQYNVHEIIINRLKAAVQAVG